MHKAIVKNYFAIHEVEHFTGFTRYMLDYLVREGILEPSLNTQDERGVVRRYSYADVVLLRALKSICVGKGKIRHLKESLLKFRMTVGPMRPAMQIARLLFVEGNELCLRTSSEGAMVLRSGQMLLTNFVIDLSAVTSEIASGVIVERGDMFRLTDAAHAAAEGIRLARWEHVRKLRIKRKEREARAERLTKAA